MPQYKIHQYYEYRSTMTVEAESAGEAAMKAQDIIDKLLAYYVDHTDMEVCDMQGEVLKIC